MSIASPRPAACPPRNHPCSTPPLMRAPHSKGAPEFGPRRQPALLPPSARGDIGCVRMCCAQYKGRMWDEVEENNNGNTLAALQHAWPSGTSAGKYVARLRNLQTRVGVIPTTFIKTALTRITFVKDMHTDKRRRTTSCNRHTRDQIGEMKQHTCNPLKRTARKSMQY